MLALATTVIDTRDLDTAKMLLAGAILVLVCIAAYSTWPLWSWEKRGRR